MLQNKKKNNNKRGGKAVVHRGLIWQTASRVSALVIGLSELGAGQSNQAPAGTSIMRRDSRRMAAQGKPVLGKDH